MNAKPALKNAELLNVVPAGGIGARLGVLTAERAKPALAIGFDSEGNIKRMIDVPLEAIRQIGGAALVTTRFAAGSLNFVNEYPHSQTRNELEAGSPVDSLVDELILLEASEAAVFGVIPGDAYVTEEMLGGMRTALERSSADAAILATRHLEGHNMRPVNRSGMMSASEDSIEYLADLGVHLMTREWLLAELRKWLSDGLRGDIWELYGGYKPTAAVLLHVPNRDPVSIDMGTEQSFRAVVSRLNANYADKSGNIAFPESVINPFSTETIALPLSSTHLPLARVVVPEGSSVYTKGQAFQG